MQIVKGVSLAAAALCGILLVLTFTGAGALFTLPGLYIGLLVAVVVLGFLAIVGHPDARTRNGEGNLSWKDLFRSAPPWTIVLCAASLVVMLVFILLLPEVQSSGETSFGLGASDLSGRPDRWRALLSFDMLFFALETMTAASAIRRRDAWMLVP